MENKTIFISNFVLRLSFHPIFKIKDFEEKERMRESE